MLILLISLSTVQAKWQRRARPSRIRRLKYSTGPIRGGWLFSRSKFQQTDLLLDSFQSIWVVYEIAQLRLGGLILGDFQFQLL